MSANIVAKNIIQVFETESGDSITALKDFNFESTQSEIVGIVGKSGCGKSTFLRLVAGLDKPESGSLEYNGKPIAGPSSERGFVFQYSTLFNWLTIYDNIAFGLKARGVFRKEEHKVQEYIDLMGLSGFEKSYPHQISGGMAARACFARTFISEPELVLLDEPLSALDAFTRIALQEELIRIQNRTQCTLILVTHDLEEAVFLCNRVIVMSERPGTNVAEIRIDLQHPRDRTSAEFNSHRREILSFFD